MRISDWSSDVCSSDLGEVVEEVLLVSQPGQRTGGLEHPQVLGPRTLEQHGDAPILQLRHDLAEGLRAGGVEHLHVGESQHDDAGIGHRGQLRSEEHTSELQSLMRISYAVFCLKKKTHSHHTIDMRHTSYNHKQ